MALLPIALAAGIGGQLLGAVGQSQGLRSMERATDRARREVALLSEDSRRRSVEAAGEVQSISPTRAMSLPQNVDPTLLTETSGGVVRQTSSALQRRRRGLELGRAVRAVRRNDLEAAGIAARLPGQQRAAAMSGAGLRLAGSLLGGGGQLLGAVGAFREDPERNDDGWGAGPYIA